MHKSLSTMLTVVIGTFIALALLDGCQYKVNTNNPQVVYAATVESAANLSNHLSHVLVDVNTFAEQYQSADPEYYAKIKPWLVRVARTNDRAANAILLASSGDTGVNWRGALLAVVAEAQSLDPTVFGFKNPTTRADAQIAFAGFFATVNSIAASFGGE